MSCRWSTGPLGGVGRLVRPVVRTVEREEFVVLCVGVDWAEDHHVVCVMAESGEVLASVTLPEGVEGVRRFHELLSGYADDPAEVAVGIETDRGLWVQAMVAGGYQVVAVNPRSVARYRERHSVSGAKSDASDAKLLADMVRTDRHNHRRVAGDSPEAEAVKVLARAHQNLVWERSRHTARLRSALREYYPAALATFDDLSSGDAVAVLTKAPTPAQGQRLSVSQIRAALRAGGRRRYLDTAATRIQAGLRTAHLAAPDPIAAAFGATTEATARIIAELNRQIEQLESQLGEAFEQHPDAGIYLSQPGLAVVLGGRVLGEFGDDPDRYADVKSRRNYAGTSPITVASGRSRIVTSRWVRNNRLYDPLIRWAFCSLTASPGARAFYDQHRAKGDTHYQALRALANRLVGILHGCLKHQTPYNEDTAWGHRQPAKTIAA